MLARASGAVKRRDALRERFMIEALLKNEWVTLHAD
jgi:hypothetical protein